MSKLECGHRKANRELVSKMATFFNMSNDELLIAWLSDKMVYEIADEDLALETLIMAEEKVQYHAQTKVDTTSIIAGIQSVLKKDSRVAAAWLFGSFARGEQKANSDVDVMIGTNPAKKISMFDLLDIAFLIEKSTKRKIDLVEKGYLKDFALNTATKDLIKIYG